jgi:hypothetical protein
MAFLASILFLIKTLLLFSLDRYREDLAIENTLSHWKSDKRLFKDIYPVINKH